MHRFFSDGETLNSPTAGLDGEEMRHARVVRLKDGEIVELFDGRGRTRRYSYRSADGLFAAAGPLEETPCGAFPATLFACVTKGERWDWTLQKSVELGAARIVPVLSERTVVRILPEERGAKLRRWQKIVREAARQSDAAWVPQVVEPVAFERALEMARGVACFAGALTDPPPESLLSAVLKRKDAFPPEGAGVFIGPEGDFTPAELSALLEVAVPASFGPRVLRAETAAIYALSVLSAACGIRQGDFAA